LSAGITVRVSSAGRPTCRRDRGPAKGPALGIGGASPVACWVVSFGPVSLTESPSRCSRAQPQTSAVPVTAATTHRPHRVRFGEGMAHSFLPAPRPIPRKNRSRLRVACTANAWNSDARPTPRRTGRAKPPPVAGRVLQRSGCGWFLAGWTAFLALSTDPLLDQHLRSHRWRYTMRLVGDFSTLVARPLPWSVRGNRRKSRESSWRLRSSPAARNSVRSCTGER
jgi:hypothetical protein